MKITEIRTSYKITMENEMCGMEMYLDTGCKVRITFDNGETLSLIHILFFITTNDYSILSFKSITFITSEIQNTIAGSSLYIWTP